MHREYLMGNEAIALGALAAGVNVVAGYPGTPSSEVLETIAKRRPESCYVEWSVNEKAAMEMAAGAAYSGARSLVTMKQVGLNVASDPLMSLAYIGVKGGMVVLVADDPGPISSQTEQDTRTFAAYSKLPCFDPSSAREAYEMVQEAFALSEELGSPVLLRPTTRVCHGYADVEVADPTEWKTSRPDGFEKDPSRWVIFPKLANANHRKIELRNEKLRESLSAHPMNYILLNGAKISLPELSQKIAVPASGAPCSAGQETTAVSPAGAPRRGIAAGGISFAYAKEASAGLDDLPLLKIGIPFPFPEELAAAFLRELDEVLVFEELDPFIERELTFVAGKYGIPVRIFGKLSHHTECHGENSIDAVMSELRAFLGEGTEGGRAASDSNGQSASEGQRASGDRAASDAAAQETSSPEPPARPPVLCAGCPHRASFYAVKCAMKGRKAFFGGDIGCYTLGNAAPLDMVDTCLCMGAGVNIAQGINRIDPETVSFAFVGDSTFFASAITGVVNAVYNQADMTLVILDNSTTAMTGHQPHPGTGRTMMGEIVEKIDPVKVLEGIGVKDIAVLDPLDFDRAVTEVREISLKPGVKAVIFRYPCISLFRPTEKCEVQAGSCINCRRCIHEIGCPAIFIDDGEVRIDSALCTGCGLCTYVCPTQAIRKVSR